MPTSRRRFVAAAGAALFAGCSGSDDPERVSTVTPVDVPQSAGDVLAAVESVRVPTVPDGPIVSTSHRESVVSHVEDRIEAADAALEAADGVGADEVERLGGTGAPFEACRSHLRDYEAAPGRLEFRRVARAFDDVATILGYARAAGGNLDAAGVRTAAENARAAYRDLADGIAYRFASPVVEHLPPVAAGEAALDRAVGHRYAADPGNEEPDDATPEVIADGWRAVESLRLETTNAAGYLETGLDPSAPPRRDAVTGAAGTHLEALAELDVPRRGDGHPVPSRIRTVLSSARSHRSEVLSAADPTDPETARGVELLLDAVRVRSQLAAYDAAGEATFTRMDGDGFPTERVMPAKRAAVDRVEALAGAPPLQRHIGGLAADMVTYGDRLQAGQGTDPVATAHFMYVAARAFADLALEHGDALAAALDPADGDNR